MSRDITTRMLYERAIAGTLVTSEILAALKEAEERGRREENEAWQEITKSVEGEMSDMEIDGDCEMGKRAYAVAATKTIRIQGRARLEEK